MNSNITKAIQLGKSAGSVVKPWGSDMVRIDNAKIMSASDAIRFFLR